MTPFTTASAVDTVLLRPATIDDAAAIARIHVETWRQAYRGLLPQAFLDSLSIEKRRIGWEKNLRENRDRVLVAELPGQVKAWISFGPCRDEGEKHLSEIYAVYVEAGFQRNRLGEQLLLQAETLLRAEQPLSNRVSLWVLVNNLPARAFYEKHGYRAGLQEKVELIGGEKHREARYEKLWSQPTLALLGD